MSFDRTRLPEPEGYFIDRAGLRLTGKGKWRTACCPLHGGDSLRVNLDSGAFACMGGCDFHGGDLLAFHMQRHGLDFVEAAKDLGCWIEDGKPAPAKPTPLPARAALQVLAFESTLTAVAAGNLAQGVTLTDADRARLLVAAGRINTIAEVFS